MNEERFGPYNLIRRIGKGGIGEVYVAVTGKRGFRRLLAIKRLLGPYNDERELVSMMADEARLSVWLTHPNIVQVFDFGRIDKTHFLAMEYVDGCDLSRLLRGTRGSHVRGRPLPLATALHATAQLLDALEYAHTRMDHNGRPLGIIHRDVSPHNILLSRSGHLKLTDFGLARASISLHKSRAGIIRGKFPYMPREQAHGEEIDRRIDIFATGVTLYECITGLRPFTASNLAQQLYQLDQPVVPPSGHIPNIPDVIDDLVMRAMARDREYRFPTAAEMAHEVRRILETISTPANETRRLANLVQRVAPPATEIVDPMPTLALLDVEVTDDSLIADEIIAAKNTLIANAPSESPTPSPPADVLSAQRTLVRSGAATSELSNEVQQKLTETAHLSNDLPDAPSMSDQQPDVETHDSPDDEASMEVAKPPLRRAVRKSDRRPYVTSADTDSLYGSIDNSQLLADDRGTPTRKRRRRRDREARHERERSRSRSVHSPAAGGLAQALNHAPRPDKPKHHNAQDAVGKLERALAAYEARDEIEHEPGTILIRHSPGFAKFAALCLGALALVGLGLAAGWVLRDKTATRDAAPAASTQLPPTTPPYAGTLPPAGTAGTRRGAASRVKGRTRVKRRRKRRARSRANLRRARRARAAAATAKTVKPSKVERKPSSNRGLMIVQAAQPADVLVNDRKRGQTPLRLELEGGIYRVKVVFSDNTTSTVRWIAVENGKEARVNFGSPETR